MGQWVEQAEKNGMDQARLQRERAKYANELTKIFNSERVDVSVAQTFLAGFETPAMMVQADLEAAGYSVVDKGFSFLTVREEGYERFALTQEGYGRLHETVLQAFGASWEYYTPGKRDLFDTLRLFPIVNDRTHFAKAEYNFFMGEGIIMEPFDDKVTTTDKLRAMIGKSLTEFTAMHSP